MQSGHRPRTYIIVWVGFCNFCPRDASAAAGELPMFATCATAEPALAGANPLKTMKVIVLNVSCQEGCAFTWHPTGKNQP